MKIEPHPFLDAGVFTTEFSAPLGEAITPDWLGDLLRLDAETPLKPDDEVRRLVRDLLRHGGYKPTGRGKPASEYLIRAATQGTLDTINPAVDACNVVSLHSGLPISVVDLSFAEAPFRVAIAEPETEYVFNPAGQVIRLDGLLCLFDSNGPCANAVKDSQRTKTSATTIRTLSVVWGTVALPGRTARAVEWYREILERVGARTETR